MICDWAIGVHSQVLRAVHRERHIAPDRLSIWRIDADDLISERVVSHSELLQ